MFGTKTLKSSKLLAAYAQVLSYELRVYPQLANSPKFDFLIPGNALGRGYGLWLALAMLISAAWEIRFQLRAPDQVQSWYHSLLAGVFAIGTALAVQLHVMSGPMPRELSSVASSALMVVALLPSAVLIYMVQRYNFLQIGRQKNLVYAVSATFLALLYLSLVRRFSGWMAPQIPPEATAATLLFVLVIFFEPLQRLLGRQLQETAQKEMDVAYRLASEVQQEARRGDLIQLQRFVERRLKAQFELADAAFLIFERGSADSAQHSSGKTLKERFAILQDRRVVGELWVTPHGALLSGETRAALEFLCGQLPGALDLCRLIDEKVRLERELAERERLAVLGQMAASISHNLKNPLGSIKTILQVQMENPTLPAAIRGETQMVLDEVGRLSAKLNQLLQFSRPAVLGGSVEASCDAAAVIEEVAGVLRHEAERRGITLELRVGTSGARSSVAADAVSDIVSNLVVNALEATPRGGRVSVAAATKNGSCLLTIEDSGAGISLEAREALLQAFFTTTRK